MNLSSQMLTIEIAGTIYAIEIDHVREILEARAMTRLPNAPAYLMGMIDLRGSSIPSADMRILMGYSLGEDDHKTRLVVVEVGGRVVALRCDRVYEVVTLDPDSFEKIDIAALLKWSDRAVPGTARHNGKQITLLDLHAFFDSALEGSTLDAVA